MIMAQTLAEVLTALAKRPDIPADARALIAVAARHTEHVSGCAVAGCGAWTEAPDPFGRCVEHMIACDACGKALEDADDGATTAGGRLLCLDCYADDLAERFDAVPVAFAREVRT